MNERRTATPRSIVKRLEADGWVLKRKGPGDHRQYAHPVRPGKVTVDMGVKDIPIGALRSVYRQSGWEW